MSVQKRIINRICEKSTLSTLLGILFIINTVLAASSVQFLLFINDNDFYVDGGEKLKNSITEEMMEKSGHDALLYFHYHLLNIYSEDTESAYLSTYKEMFSEEKSNFFFRITDTGKNENKVIFSNFDAESGKDYYPDSDEFFNSVENVMLIRSTDTLNFEGHLKKEMTADDAYSRLEGLFGFINSFKYALAVLAVLFVIFEIFLAYFLCRCAGHKNGINTLAESEIDRIPSYILTIFYVPAFVVGVYFLNKKFVELCDLRVFAETAEIGSRLYSVVLLWIFLAVCVKTLLETVSVRIKSPRWWQRSWMYRLAGFKKNIQTIIGFLIAAAACEFSVFMMSSIFGGGKLKWIAIFAEAGVTVMVCYIIIFVERNVYIWIKGTRSVAVKKKGRIPVHELTGSYLQHAKNINFLSKSASAEMEKRYINESFSTKLINGVSSNIKTPLSRVLLNVEELKDENISIERQNECIAEINKLSVMLKKTIEDIILISKATTGNLESNPDYTDMGVFLSQIIGEYYGMFMEKNMSISEEREQDPVIVNADSRFMWYVFDSVFSVIYKKGLSGARVHLYMKKVGDKVVFVFKSSIVPSDDDIFADGDLSLPTAKVFTELQGGEIYFNCKKDIMTVVLRFPLARIGDTKKDSTERVRKGNDTV